jgi:uncharacterized membrane protein
MSVPTEPSLRLVKSSHDVVDAVDESAQTSPGYARDAGASRESPALAAEVSGEIKTDGRLAAQTLIGVAPFPGTPKPRIGHAHLHVMPATVAAIEKAKRASSPQLEALPKVMVEPSVADPVEQPRPRPRIVKDPPPPPPSEQGQHDPRWKNYEDLGLAPKPLTRKAQKLVVSTYRLVGFGILSIIVAVLVGYIGTTAFYFFNKTWVTPVAISPHDEKVVTLQGQLAAQLNERDRLVTELDNAERAIAAEQAFQLAFAKAIRQDLEGRRFALNRARQLAHAAAATRKEIRTTNGDYSESHAKRVANEYEAGMINRDSMLASKFQLAQISSANLSLAERQAEFDLRAQELASQTKALDALLANKGTAALSYDVLKIARDYETSKLALARDTANRDRLKAAVARQQTIIAGIEQSAHLRALANDATVALVPYDNLANATEGAPLYACRMNMVLCREVGKVLAVLPGEVQVKHPNRDNIVRGRMIEMQLTDPAAAHNTVLFAGGKPLKF